MGCTGLFYAPTAWVHARSEHRTEFAYQQISVASHEVTVLDIYRHLFYAGARTLEQQLPEPECTHHPVVVLRIRGYNDFGPTLLDALPDYAEKLKAVDDRLYISGMSGAAYDQVVESGRIKLMGSVHGYEAEPVVWKLTTDAVRHARA